MDGGHISDGALIAALRGHLPESELLTMKAHFGECPDCERRLWSAVRDLIGNGAAAPAGKAGRSQDFGDLAYCA